MIIIESSLHYVGKLSGYSFAGNSCLWDICKLWS